MWRWTCSRALYPPFWSSHTRAKTDMESNCQDFAEIAQESSIYGRRQLPGRSFLSHGDGLGKRHRFRHTSRFFRSSRLGELLFFAFLTRNNIPIALLNRSDVGEIPAGSDWYYRRCHACFVRELNPQPEMSLKICFPFRGQPSIQPPCQKDSWPF